jgi:hypothetical protein
MSFVREKAAAILALVQVGSMSKHCIVLRLLTDLAPGLRFGLSAYANTELYLSPSGSGSGSELARGFCNL